MIPELSDKARFGGGLALYLTPNMALIMRYLMLQLNGYHTAIGRFSCNETALLLQSDGSRSAKDIA